LTLSVVKEYSRRLTSGIEIYQEGRCLPNPLALKLFQILSPLRLWIPFLIGMDFLTAIKLEQIDKFLGLVYFLNPLAVMSTISRSWGPIDNFLFSNLLVAILSNQPLLASGLLALSTKLSFYPIVHLPLVLLNCKKKSINFQVIFTFISVLSALLIASFKYSGNSWSFLKCTFGCNLLFLDFKPNIGLWWYLFIEMFDHFRPFFLVTFQMMVFFHVLPLTVKFHKLDRLFCAFIVQATVNILKPYPAISDLAIITTLGFHELKRLKTDKNAGQIQFIKCLAVYGGGFLTLMIPKVWHFWIIQASGNANFYFAAICAVNLIQIISVIMMIKLKLEQFLLHENSDIDLEKVAQY
jgi:GPI-anchor transamidase subunit U